MTDKTVTDNVALLANDLADERDTIQRASRILEAAVAYEGLSDRRDERLPLVRRSFALADVFEIEALRREAKIRQGYE